jgi:hypothetical protein
MDRDIMMAGPEHDWHVAAIPRCEVWNGFFP